MFNVSFEELRCIKKQMLDIYGGLHHVMGEKPLIMILTSVD